MKAILASALLLPLAAMAPAALAAEAHLEGACPPLADAPCLPSAAGADAGVRCVGSPCDEINAVCMLVFRTPCLR